MTKVEKRLKMNIVKALFISASILIFNAGLQPVKADEIPMAILTGGNGPGQNGGTVSETVIGTFQFDAVTVRVLNVMLFGTGIVSEYWALGPVQGWISLPGYEAFTWAGNVGSQGDILQFSIEVNKNGGFVEPNGASGISSGSAATSDFNFIDYWGGTITPVSQVPENTSFLLFSTGVAILLVLARIEDWLKKRKQWAQ